MHLRKHTYQCRSYIDNIRTLSENIELYVRALETGHFCPVRSECQ
jgi:hypothetical protein